MAVLLMRRKSPLRWCWQGGSVSPVLSNPYQDGIGRLAFPSPAALGQRARRNPCNHVTNQHYSLIPFGTRVYLYCPCAGFNSGGPEYVLLMTNHYMCCSSACGWQMRVRPSLDRKSTRLNSSHVAISYAVFCLKQ